MMNDVTKYHVVRAATGHIKDAASGLSLFLQRSYCVYLFLHAKGLASQPRLQDPLRLA